MNDPNKAIDVNLSSLLSLKAELLRKQAEVSRAKATRTPADEYESAPNAANSSAGKRDKKQRAQEVSKQDDATVYEHEDTELLEKSQRVLEAKSKFYERMRRTGGKLNSDDNCLVLFNRKRQEAISDNDEQPPERKVSSGSEVSSSDDDDEETVDPEDDWVEYTDCLGRTRKCLRRDLKDVKRRDGDLAASMPERLDQTKPNWMIDTKGAHVSDEGEESDDAPIGPMPTESVYSDGCSLMSKHDEQRANWERKEQENFDKSDVHYQDVFFDEARQHGVGYYAFSTDEAERERQQRELEESRKQTTDEQKHREALREQREKVIAERVRAAKNRQRARLGLPPLELIDEEEQKLKNADEPKETKEERKERKRVEKLKRKQEKLEAERELERQQHIRPWDKEKDGVKPSESTDGFETATEPEWSYKPEREPMSQEQWNDSKRSERQAEFAPFPEPWSAQPKRTHFTSMPPPAAPPFNYNYNTEPPPFFTPTSTFVNCQSTKREKQFQRRNYQLDDTEEPQEDRVRAAIPPPTDLDSNYTLPPHAKKTKSNVELERSIEAGLRFLRNNSDKDTMSTKSSWSAKADY